MGKWKRFVALGTAMGLLLTATACGGTDEGSKDLQESQGAEPSGTEADVADSTEEEEAESAQDSAENSGNAQEEIPWLNTSGTLPIVEEGTEKTLRVYLGMGSAVAEPEAYWFYDFIEDVMNINLEITPITGENRNEMISLAFAGDELPDLILCAGMSADELMKYGALEGQILDLAPYFNETYMPNLRAICEKSPGVLSIIQDSEGHIWSTGFARSPDELRSGETMFLNYDWLETCGMEVPTTLEEFYDMLVAFKGLDQDNYPFCGSSSAHNPCYYVLNAFGYVGANSSGTNIALRNGKVVLPVADREAYGAYLAFMNRLYEEGLMHPDFFTLDNTTVEAMFKEGRFGMWEQMVSLYTEDITPWWGALPLTSEYNDSPKWAVRSNLSSCGQGVVTSACQEPELAAVFLDWFYDFHHYMVSTNGAIVDVDPDEWLCGAGGRFRGEDGEWVHNDVLNGVDGWTSGTEYLQNRIRLFPAASLGSYFYDGGDTENDLYPYVEDYEDIEDVSLLRSDEALLKNPWWYCVIAMHKTLDPYRTSDIFPGTVYFDADTTEQLANSKTAIDQYATQESAKFITGARPLEEVDDYFDEMERLGALEYVQTYQEYYDSIQ